LALNGISWGRTRSKISITWDIANQLDRQNLIKSGEISSFLWVKHQKWPLPISQSSLPQLQRMALRLETAQQG
jgi:hypothetical protein